MGAATIARVLSLNMTLASVTVGSLLRLPLHQTIRKASARRSERRMSWRRAPLVTRIADAPPRTVHQRRAAGPTPLHGEKQPGLLPGRGRRASEGAAGPRDPPPRT